MYKIKTKKIIVIFLIFLHYIRVLEPLENLVLTITKPISERVYKTSVFIKNNYSDYSETQNQLEKIEKLEFEISQLIVENAQLKTAQEENQKLRDYLNFLDKKEYNHVLANIISQGISIDPEEKEGSVIIDKGELHNVVPGLLVVNQSGIVVGKIKSVKTGSAEVVLVTSNECRLAASIYGTNRTSGIVEGRLGLTMVMDFIPQSEDIDSRDLVLTSGLEQNIPKGLVIGRVSEIDSSGSEVWQKASIEPLFDSNDLTIVTVLVP